MSSFGTETNKVVVTEEFFNLFKSMIQSSTLIRDRLIEVVELIIKHKNLFDMEEYEYNFDIPRKGFMEFHSHKVSDIEFVNSDNIDISIYIWKKKEFNRVVPQPDNQKIPMRYLWMKNEDILKEIGKEDV